MRLGLLGGSFDPIHFGHLRAAENAREALGLGQVRFIPAGEPPHKPKGGLSAAEDRLAMVRLATASNPAFTVSDLEVRRDGPSYTLHTLLAIAAEPEGHEIFLIVGSDTLSEMESWREPQRIFGLCTVAVAARPGARAGGPPAGARVVTVPGPELPLSATAVRERARGGGSVRYLVPDAVADYIETRRLYR
jgi:nicotinate-nucleotide adenylyltransferase